MANNPRKFSEKIALHNHRQAEETARFEQIMKEVSDATARVGRERYTDTTPLMFTATTSAVTDKQSSNGFVFQSCCFSMG